MLGWDEMGVVERCSACKRGGERVTRDDLCHMVVVCKM